MRWENVWPCGHVQRRPLARGQDGQTSGTTSAPGVQNDAVGTLQAQLEEQGLAVEFRAAVAVIRPDAVSFSAGFALTPEAFFLAVIISRLQGAGLAEEEQPQRPAAAAVVQPTQPSG